MKQSLNNNRINLRKLNDTKNKLYLQFHRIKRN